MLCITFYACQKEYNSKSDNTNVNDLHSNDTLSIEEGKIYLKKELGLNSNIIPLESFTYISKIGGNYIDTKQKQKSYTFWDRAHSYNLDGFNVVEVPLAINNRTISVHNIFSTDTTAKSAETIVNSSFSRILIYRRIGEKILHRKIITYTPDVRYLKNHRFDGSSNWLNQIDKDFSGYIEYKNWNQKVSTLLKIDGGKVMSSFDVSESKSTPSKINTESMSTSTTTTTTCYVFSTPVYLTTCAGPIEGASGNESCSTVITGYNYYTYCYTIVGGVPVQPVPNPGTGGGGGTTPPVTTGGSTADHKLPNQNKLPPATTTDTQVGAMCVFKTLEWVSKFFGGVQDGYVSVGQSLLYFSTSNNLTFAQMQSVITTDGITSGQLVGLVSHYYQMTATTNIKGAIDNGHTLMATLISSSGGHEVMITGYNNNGTIEYFDPELGHYDKKIPSAFNLVYEISYLP